jgi:hypothetical protein
MMRRSLCFAGMVTLFLSLSWGEIIVDGTRAQRDKVANWLTRSLGTTVTIDDAGRMSIRDGGNASARRLRNMINDAGTRARIRIVENDPNVSIGGWQSADPANPKGRSTGTQVVDIGDIEGIGNVINSYGETPDANLMHEITEVYEGVRHGFNYQDAHLRGDSAGVELMSEHGTSYVIPRWWDGGYVYRKIRRPDGSFVVIRLRPRANPQRHEWFRERVPCRTDSGLIVIPDPDPQVHILSYNSNLDHEIVATIDKENSSPVAVAFDYAGNLLVVENLGQTDEIRVLTLEGELVKTIRHELLIDPEGIDVDPISGDVFVAVKGRVIRFTKEMEYLGQYSSGKSGFAPTDVAVWRAIGTGEISFAENEYDLFVTDRKSGNVFRFDVQGDINKSTSKIEFGGNVLSKPEGLFIDFWYTVWVASTGNNRIYRFTPTGQLEPFGGREYFVEDTSRLFFDLAVVDLHGVYVVDARSRQGSLLLFDLVGTLKREYGKNVLQCPTSLAVRFTTNSENLIAMTAPGEESEFPTLIVVAVLIAIALALYLIFRKKR